MALVSSPSLSWTPSIFPSSFTTRRPSIYWAMKDGNGTDVFVVNAALFLYLSLYTKNGK
ncbi:hypothetical protein WUBG_06523 [Wuchereria bancrofti]|uniref:Uncharacterized protein n=1 Tax=Wuchereria bancrofti TaxID=6293 RepID=J9F5F7_WUCBA|nr:hypothetical protein WUBG_06523 [Wuchereria bancrofti]